VLVGYRSGALLTYSLNAHSPWEGYRVSVNGDAGRAELEVVERGQVRSVADGSVSGRPAVDPMVSGGEGAADAGDLRPVSERLLVQRHWEPTRAVPIPEAAGAHAGGDEPLLDSLLRRDAPADPLDQRADYVDGLASVAIGLAANESIATGHVVDVSQLGLELSRAPGARTSWRRRRTPLDAGHVHPHSSVISPSAMLSNGSWIATRPPGASRARRCPQATSRPSR
jgi:Oxidoreductase family, C-terminal alpha/beta domain